MNLASALIFRLAQRTDLEKIVAIYNQTISSRMVTADTEPVEVADRVSWWEQHHPETRPLLVIEKNEEVIGWVSFQDFYGRPAYRATAEISIYLEKKHRGHGNGRTILRHCLLLGPKLGIKNLIGFIFSHNKPSLSLFSSEGFQVWGQLPDIALLDGEEKSLCILGKRITH